MADKIDQKLIEGLSYHYNEEREVEDGDTVTRKKVAAKRLLTPDDVLDWKKNDDGTHSILTACGKHWVRSEDPASVTFTRQGVSPDFYAKDKQGNYLKNRPLVIPKAAGAKGKDNGKTA
jgi:hypothetical protein